MNEKCIDVKRYILTGTPGSGKTSVVLALEKMGYVIIHEAATDVIAIEQAAGTERPWESPDFVDKITHMQKTRQISANGALQFYDRSPFCTYALGQYLSQLNHAEFTPTPTLLEEIDRCLKNNIYEKKVFFFENLGFITHTNARKISYEDALIFEQIHLDVYQQFGFDSLIVPKELMIEKRCDFIKQNLPTKNKRS